MTTPYKPYSLLGALMALALLSTPSLSEEQAAVSAVEPEATTAESAEPAAAAAEAPATETSAEAEPAASAEPAPATEQPQAATDYRTWLDKVRSQRKAQREAHAQAMDDARKSRYPGSPWSEDMDKQREAYVDAMRQRAEMQRQALRNHRRWINPRSEYIRDIQEQRRKAMEAQIQAQREYWEQLRQQQAKLWDTNPYGWNNPWYYRGY